MENFVELFNKITNTQSTKDKMSILKEFKPECDLMRCLYYCYSPKVLFGITSKQCDKNVEKNNYENNLILKIFVDIINTQGHLEKLKIINAFRKVAAQEVYNYFLNIIDKDLGIGVNVKLINKVFPNLIEEFPLMLAFKQTKEDFYNNFKDIEFVYVNPKYDGIRCICEKKKDKILFFSRDGKLLSDFLVSNIKKDLVKYDFDFTIDGELFTSKFQDLMKILNRKDINANSIFIRDSCKFVLFDVLYIKEKDLKNTQLKDRIETFNFFNETNFIKKCEYIKVIPDYNLLLEIAKKYIEKGQEGIIVKNPESLYVGKRSKAWLKFKNHNSIDLKIIGIEEGKDKYQNMLGALILSLDNGGKVNCGTGYTDEEREELWKRKDELIGMIAEIKYMEKTGNDLSLRHPVFIRIRDDRS